MEPKYTYSIDIGPPEARTTISAVFDGEKRGVRKKLEKPVFEVDEIAVFVSHFRFETYVALVQQIHLDEPWMSPTIRKATLAEKKAWYDNDNYELVIKSDWE